MAEQKNLFIAIIESDTATIVASLSSGNLSRIKEWSMDNGYSLLRLALLKGDEEIAEFLLEKGASICLGPNENPKSLRDMLVETLREDDVRTYDWMLREHHDEFSTSNQHKPLLHIAAARSSSELMMMIIRKSIIPITERCRLGKIALHDAAESGRVQNVEFLLDHGAPVNDRIPRMSMDSCKIHENTLRSVHNSFGYTPLHCACESGNNDRVIRLLLSSGADVNAQADDKSTPLHVAARRKLTENIEVLLKHGGADSEIRDVNGDTVLDVAIKMMDHATLSCILDHASLNNVKRRRKILKKALSQPTSEGSTRTVDTLVERDFTVCTRDANDRNLLRNAIEKGCYKIVEDLLKHGTSVRTEFLDLFRRGPSLLHLAVSHDHIEIAELLMKHGVDVHAKDERKRTPIFTAIRAMNTSMIKLLLANRANVNDRDTFGITPLHYLALTENHLPVRDPNENTSRYLRKINEERFTLGDARKESESRAATVGEIAELFLSRGASVDAKTCNGFTILHAASAGHHAAIVKALLDHSADVDCIFARDNDKTSLHYSAAAGNDIICKMLLDKGAKVNVRDKNGRSPLHVACHCSQENVVKVLLDNGAEINSRDSEDRTPLYVAAARGSSKIVQILLDQGTCELDATSRYGITALDSALMRKWTVIVEDILSYGFNIDGTSKQYRKLLSHARKTPNDRRRCSGRPETRENESSFDVDEEFEYDVRVKINNYDTGRTCEILRNCIVKLIALDRIAGEVLSDITLNVKYIEFLHDCEREIDQLKSTNIGDGPVSFHGVLTAMNMRKLSSVAIYDCIREALKLADYEKMFPIYSGIIRMRFKKALHQIRLLNEGRYCLNFLAGFVIPDLPLMELLSYLSFDDLYSVTKARV